MYAMHENSEVWLRGNKTIADLLLRIGLATFHNKWSDSMTSLSQRAFGL
jgi:hypothetical protein